jgi:hypothetical protein
LRTTLRAEITDVQCRDVNRKQNFAARAAITINQSRLVAGLYAFRDQSFSLSLRHAGDRHSQ